MLCHSCKDHQRNKSSTFRSGKILPLMAKDSSEKKRCVDGAGLPELQADSDLHCMSRINLEWCLTDLMTVYIPIQLSEKLLCITNK